MNEKRFIKAMVGWKAAWVSFAEYLRTNKVEVIFLDGKKAFLPLTDISIGKGKELLNCLYHDLEAIYDLSHNELQVIDDRVMKSQIPIIQPNPQEWSAITFLEGKTEAEIEKEIRAEKWQEKKIINKRLINQINWNIRRN